MGEIKRSTCPHDCWDCCSLLVQVEDGKVVRVKGNPEHPTTRGFLCVKVNHYEERVHSADRILHPLRRVGAKGEGRFARISWEEALAETAARLGEVRARWGGEAILPYSYAGTMGVLQNGSMDRRFFHHLGATRLDRTICVAAGAAATAVTLGTSLGPDPEDIVDCKLIILWGLNMVSSNVHQVPLVKEAMRRGCQVVCIDPVKNRTARLAHWHLQPLPGTDVALVLGLMHVIFRDGLQDQDYLEQFTVGWAELRDRVREWTPARVEATTGVPAADVERLARLYATIRPSLVRVGYGVQRNSNGGSIVRALAMLPALTGAWRDACGGFLLGNGYSRLNKAPLYRADLMPSPLPRLVNMIELGKALGDLDDPPVKALFVYNSNPASVAPNQNKVVRGLEREDLFVVVSEQLMTDTARYADIVFPATTMLEHSDLYWSYWHLYLQYTDPVIPPLGEAVPNTELFRRLAAAMGFTDPCFRDSDDEMLRQTLTATHTPYLEGITLARLKAEGIVRCNVPRGHRPFAAGFPTPSGKVELYSHLAAGAGLDPVLAYVPPAESAGGSPDLHRRYPLALVTPGAHHFLNSTFANLPSLQVSEAQPAIHLNPADAEARGLKSGDWVRAFNDRGSVHLRVVADDHTAPGVAVAFSLWWNQDSPGGAGLNALTSDAISDLGRGPIFHTCLIEAEAVPVEALPAAPARQRELAPAGDD